MMTPESPSPAPVDAGVIEDSTQLRKRLDAAFTAETPVTARTRIIDAIILALNEPND